MSKKKSKRVTNEDLLKQIEELQKIIREKQGGMQFIPYPYPVYTYYPTYPTYPIWCSSGTYCDSATSVTVTGYVGGATDSSGNSTSQ